MLTLGAAKIVISDDGRMGGGRSGERGEGWSGGC